MRPGAVYYLWFAFHFLFSVCLNTIVFCLTSRLKTYVCRPLGHMIHILFISVIIE